MEIENPVEPEVWLRGSPYLVASDEHSLRRFLTIYEGSGKLQERARAVAEQVAEDAHEILEPFGKALRTDLVVESNALEGYEWTRPEVQRVVELHRELVSGPLHNFMNALRGDQHLMEALGLYRAYLIADEWAENQDPPREYEIRGLHAVILAGAPEGGRYKTRINEIVDSDHTPLDPFEVEHAMAELAGWWRGGSPDPVLDATVVHAWLTHIHPFEDGNGRLARLLGNLSLTQSGYPPLIVRSSRDRGQYIDALAASDDGDILPLYDLFSGAIKRAVRTMAKPGYARDFVQGTLLRTQTERYEGWLQITRHFTDCVRKEIRALGWDAFYQGYPDLPSFELLCERSSAGRGWWLKVTDPDKEAKWLLFFGYQTDLMADMLGSGDQCLPSIFLSLRTDDPEAVHPFRWVLDDWDDLLDEIVLRPGERRPTLIRTGTELAEHTVGDAAILLARALTRHA